MVGGFCAVDSERAVSVLDQLAFDLVTGHSELCTWNLRLQFILVFLFNWIRFCYQVAVGSSMGTSCGVVRMSHCLPGKSKIFCPDGLMGVHPVSYSQLHTMH